MNENKRIELLEKRLENLQALNHNLSNQLEKKEIEAKQKRNHNFVQLYRDQLLPMRKLANTSRTALSVLLLLVEKMNKQNAIMISQNTLSKILGKSRQTISKAICLLKEEKFITTVKVGSTYTYIINANVFWQNSIILKDKEAIFTATIYAVGEEQDEGYFENWDGVKLKKIPNLNNRN